MFIDNGFYIQEVNAASIAGYHDYDAFHYLAFQIYEEDGSPAKGSYKGPGKVVEHEGKKYVVLGNPHTSTQLPTYLLSETPDQVSEKSLDEFVAGFRAAMEGKRSKKNADHSWREGFAEAKKLRERGKT